MSKAAKAKVTGEPMVAAVEIGTKVVLAATKIPAVISMS